MSPYSSPYAVWITNQKLIQTILWGGTLLAKITCLDYTFIFAWGSRKKSNFFSGLATKRGGGKGLATMKKNFFGSSKKKSQKGLNLFVASLLDLT